MEENEKLKPCPICNSKAESYMVSDVARNKWLYYVKCTNPNCATQTFKYEAEKLAISEWNVESKNETNRVLTQQNILLRNELKTISIEVFEALKIAERNNADNVVTEKLEYILSLLPQPPTASPCVYCGAPGRVVPYLDDTWCVQCSDANCFATGPIAKTSIEAIEKWNEIYKMARFPESNRIDANELPKNYVTQEDRGIKLC